MTDPKPTFATNHGGDTVAAAVGGHIRWVLDTWKHPPAVAIATAYFNPGGFGLLADVLEEVAMVRLMLGAEPASKPARPRSLKGGSGPEHAERARVRRALEGHSHDIRLDRDLLGFDLDADASAARLVEWLRSGTVEVRRFEEGFLHGKAFLVTTDDDGVIAGSSNFTYAGLAKNHELNLGHYDPPTVRRVVEWFEGLWNVAEPFDLAAIYEARYEPHTPYLVYLRMLLERYGHELEAELAGDFGLHLARFQEHGVERAERILAERNGVLIADGVGLGKSFIAGELIRRAVQERRQRVLVVAPAALRDGMWEKFKLTHGLPVEVVSFEELAADPRLNPKATGAGRLLFGIDEYAMVVVDEAHAFRNPQTDRAAVLRKLLAGTPPKQLVMLTATPVNNTLWDLYYLLAYFIKNDAAFAPQGIRGLRDHFGKAMAMEPNALSPDLLFDVLDTVAVRRTRSFVKRWYPNERITIGGLQVPIVFPRPTVRRIDYEIDDLLPGMFARLAHALDCDAVDCPEPDRAAEHPTAKDAPVLSLVRYSPTSYLLDIDVLADRSNQSPEAIEARRRLAAEGSLGGLLRSGLLKRFESSGAAFAATCRKMAASHDAFLGLLAKGVVATGDRLAEWSQADGDDLLEVLGDLDGLDEAARYDAAALRDAVKADRDLLIAFAEEAEQVTPENDPKLAALVDELATIAAEAADEGLVADDIRDKRKVIVFSYFADTARWVHDRLEQVVQEDARLADYRDRVVMVTGSDGEKKTALFGFAPQSSEAPAGTTDRFDVMVATDVLAEGVNLQQGRHIVNYDLPWNPMRLVQRHGRIDRIGSAHAEVYLRCFFPAKELDVLLELESRLQRKIAQAARSIGVEGEVIPGSEAMDITFAETREEIERIHREEAGIFEQGGERGHAFSGEEYRQELRKGLENPVTKAEVMALPWGSGSGLVRKGADPGFVFCARVGDHPEPLFRYVNMANAAVPEVLPETLVALSHAHAGPEDARVLDEPTHRSAYGAWAVARRHILDEWVKATDHHNLLPDIPKALREASDHVQRFPPAGLGGQTHRPGGPSPLERLVASLEAPYPNGIVAQFRDILRDDQKGSGEKSEAILDLVIALGLEPQVPPEPLPEITVDDVHLVCWQAIVGGE